MRSHVGDRRAASLRPATFGALRYRNFRYLWLGQIAQSASLWIEQVARALLVIYLIPDPSQAAIHVGLVLAVRTMPSFAFGLLGGVFADWYDRRKLLLFSKSATALVNFSLVALLIFGVLDLWHVYLTSFLRGISGSFDQPARQALVPSLIPARLLRNAVALNSAGMQATRIGGASLAGVLVAVGGFAGAFLAAALLTSAAVMFTYLLRVRPLPPVATGNVKAAVASFRAGARYAWAADSIRGTITLTMAFFFFGMAYIHVFAPLIAAHALGVGPAGFGLMVSAAGLGAVVGLLVMASVPSLPPRGPLMLALMGLLGLVLVAFGLSPYLAAPALTFALIGAVGLLQACVFALANMVLMESAEEHMRGRIMGLLSLDRSAITGGGVLAGMLAGLIGPQLGQAVFGASCVVLAVILAWALPSMRGLR